MSPSTPVKKRKVEDGENEVRKGFKEEASTREISSTINDSLVKRQKSNNLNDEGRSKTKETSKGEGDRKPDDSEGSTPASPKKGEKFTREEDMRIIEYFLSRRDNSSLKKILPGRASSSIARRIDSLFKKWKEVV